ncbi:mrpl7 [[Candida] subhashii]|uniref:Mrpl7 n=1 Tax=[Candida] subhashii TaxID=561895 RepID=A0A8J5QG08_9ASCO|nr:mrpl7 [[Candida] subhashii]KAG7661423.1 mrpl7 [[Candida] subhashii]
MSKAFIRQFSRSAPVSGKGYSTVHPVHHLVKVEKSKLKPGYKDLLIPKDDIRSVKYKPTEYSQDRLVDYYNNTLKSDLLLQLYDHEAKVIKGATKKSWGTDSPYKLFRPLRKIKGGNRSAKDILPISHENIPEVTEIVVMAFNKKALELPHLNISTRLQLSQITNVKPKQIRAKANILPWKIRHGKECGGKSVLTGLDLSQFISTLTELVLPRIRAFKGIKNTSGDCHGNISFGLTAEDVSLFPEIEHYQELFPSLCGFDVTFKTTARTDEQARILLSGLGFPFYNPSKNSQE